MLLPGGLGAMTEWFPGLVGDLVDEGSVEDSKNCRLGLGASTTIAIKASDCPGTARSWLLASLSANATTCRCNDCPVAITSNSPVLTC